jgi:hypothetical protein
MPFYRGIPQPHNLHIATHQQMPLALLPRSQDAARMRYGVQVGYHSECRRELCLAWGLVVSPYPDAPFGYIYQLVVLCLHNAILGRMNSA